MSTGKKNISYILIVALFVTLIFSSSGTTVYAEQYHEDLMPDKNLRIMIEETLRTTHGIQIDLPDSFVEYGPTDDDLATLAAITGTLTLIGADYKPIITNAKGIELFSSISELYIDNNNLISLDVSDMNNLTFLSCVGNKLTSLELGSLTSLENLICSNNQLNSLDVNALINLKYLYCGGNNLSSLNVNALTKLNNLNCGGNNLSSLNVNNLTSLKSLVCGSNNLSSLNVDALSSLKFLECPNNQLTTLNLSNQKLLESLCVENNQLTSLDVREMSKLDFITCENNQLSSLDLTGKTFNNYSILSPQKSTLPLSYIGNGSYAAALPISSTSNLITGISTNNIQLNGNIASLINPGRNGSLGYKYKTGATNSDSGTDMLMNVEYAFNAETISMNDVTATKVTDKVYNGKAQKPAVSLKFWQASLEEGVDYNITYKNNKNPGKATITITGAGNYSGSKTIYFKIKPKSTSIKKIQSLKKKAKVSWKKSTGASGYQVVFSTKKNKGFKSAGVTKKLALTKGKLKSGKTYFFKVRPYKTIDGKKVYGAYSKVKKVKVK